ncbi:MAG: hypothetical protein PHX94_01005 [Bacteroidales bacterium]|jgi:hypothetical protein|nr:hypothetical protein [Bacteroidales bacterium]OQB67521.1 MAG: hypothetical protein BWX93_01759 [Bacteroidetes bacterium ADurb.Bin139]HOZ20117.1 hypothetical protein [Bacteroidales bacterium]
MKGFNLWIYLRRVAKYIVYYTIIILILLLIVYYTSDNRNITFWELIRPGSQTNLIILIVAFSAVYPFLGFSKKEVYTNRFSEQDKEAAIRIFSESGFILISDQDGKMVFKSKRIAMRVFRVFEDKITLDYRGDQLTVEGMRRDIQRIASHLGNYFRSVREDE